MIVEPHTNIFFRLNCNKCFSKNILNISASLSSAQHSTGYIDQIEHRALVEMPVVPIEQANWQDNDCVQVVRSCQSQFSLHLFDFYLLTDLTLYFLFIFILKKTTKLKIPAISLKLPTSSTFLVLLHLSFSLEVFGHSLRVTTNLDTVFMRVSPTQVMM